MIHTFEQRLQAEPHTLHQLRCTPGYQTTALQPVPELLHQICEFRAADSQEARQAKLAAALERLGLATSNGLVLLSNLLGLPRGRELAALDLSPQQIKQNSLGLIADMQRLAARRRPLLIVVEDLNWVDPSTLDLIRLLSRGIEQSAMLILLTARPGFEHPWRRAGDAAQLSLSALGTAEVRRLATAVARNKPLPELVLQQIVARTDGIPLFVEELTKTLLESELLRETHARYELAGAATTVALPFTLHDSLMARLDRLESAKHVAQLAAVLGREFPYALLRDLAGMDESQLQLALSRLVEADLLYRHELDRQTLYGFRHALIHEAAYESLLRRHRQDLHARVAQQLERLAPAGDPLKPEFLAHHFQEAGLSAEAIVYWQQAGQQAGRQSAHGEAAGYFRQGLRLLRELPRDDARDQQELALCMSIGVPLMLSSGPVPEIEQAYARALELSQNMPESHDLLPALRGLYTYYAGRADYRTAERLARQLLRIAEEQSRGDFLLEAHRALGTVLLLKGELVPAAHHLEYALRLYQPDIHHALAFQYGMDPGIGAFSLLAISDWVMGYPDRARRRVTDAIALASSRGHPSTLGWALNVGLTIMELRRDPQAILQLSDRLTALAEKHHTPLWTLWSRIMRDKAQADMGDSEQALIVIGDSFAEYDRIGAAMGRPYALAVWADTCLKSGRIDEGLQIVRDALAWIAEHSAHLHEAELHRLEGELLMAAEGDPAGKRAEAAFERALRLARAQGARAFELRAATGLARLLIRHRRADEARAPLAAAIQNISEESESRDVLDARKLLRTMDEQFSGA